MPVAASEFTVIESDRHGCYAALDKPNLLQIAQGLAGLIPQQRAIAEDTLHSRYSANRRLDARKPKSDGKPNGRSAGAIGEIDSIRRG